MSVGKTISNIKELRLKTVPFLSLSSQHEEVRAEAMEAFARVYDKNVFVLGEELSQFETEFAGLCGTRYSLGVGNGLDALTLALKSLKLSPGDEVIVPSHTYLATWLAVTRVGCKPVPVEPNTTMNIDASGIEAAITPKTRVILPVHLYGQACDMTAILDIARKHSLQVVEDNAQAVGSKWDGRPTGGFGIVNATSFFPTKNLGALGDGGAVTTSNENIKEDLRQLRSYGFETPGVANIKGVNSRLDELQAALLRVKMKKLGAWTERRRALARLYNDRLRGIGDLVAPETDERAFHVYHLYVIQTSRRDELRAHLLKHGVNTMIHYPIPPHLQKALGELGYANGSFPIAERLARTIISLPLHPGLTEDDVDYVCERIREFYG